MKQRQQQQLDKLLARAERDRGLGHVAHRNLTRLIEQADAEDKLLTGSAIPGKAIVTSRSREVLIPPCSGEKVGEVNR